MNTSDTQDHSEPDLTVELDSPHRPWAISLGMLFIFCMIYSFLFAGYLVFSVWWGFLALLTPMLPLVYELQMFYRSYTRTSPILTVDQTGIRCESTQYKWDEIKGIKQSSWLTKYTICNLVLKEPKSASWNLVRWLTEGRIPVFPGFFEKILPAIQKIRPDIEMDESLQKQSGEEPSQCNSRSIAIITLLIKSVILALVVVVGATPKQLFGLFITFIVLGQILALANANCFNRQWGTYFLYLSIINTFCPLFLLLGSTIGMPFDQIRILLIFIILMNLLVILFDVFEPDLTKINQGIILAGLITLLFLITSYGFTAEHHPKTQIGWHRTNLSTSVWSKNGAYFADRYGMYTTELPIFRRSNMEVISTVKAENSIIQWVGDHYVLWTHYTEDRGVLLLKNYSSGRVTELSSAAKLRVSGIESLNNNGVCAWLEQPKDGEQWELKLYDLGRNEQVQHPFEWPENSEGQIEIHRSVSWKNENTLVWQRIKSRNKKENGTNILVELRFCDLASGDERTWTSPSGYKDWSFSSNYQYAFVNNGGSIDLFQIEKGMIASSVFYTTMPVWLTNSQQAIGLRKQKLTKQLVRYDVQSGKKSRLINVPPHMKWKAISSSGRFALFHEKAEENIFNRYLLVDLPTKSKHYIQMPGMLGMEDVLLSVSPEKEYGRRGYHFFSPDEKGLILSAPNYFKKERESQTYWENVYISLDRLSGNQNE